MAEQDWLTKDFYQVLGVAEDASSEQITKAYRKLARKYHPDVNSEAKAEEQFKAISEAYDVLGNAEQRKKYDAIRKFGAGGARFTGGTGASGFDASGFSDIFSAFGGAGGFSGSSHGGFADIFSMFAGGAGPSAQSTHTAHGNPYMQQYADPEPEQGADITMDIALTLRQALKGSTVSVSSGHKKFKTKTPAGVKDGQKIRLTGKGKSGKNGGRAGDLYLRIHVKPDERWRMEGSDLVGKLDVSVGQAVNGGLVSIVDWNGQGMQVEIPAGSTTGTRVALETSDVTLKHGGVFAELSVQIPSKLNDAARRLAAEFDAATA